VRGSAEETMKREGDTTDAKRRTELVRWFLVLPAAITATICVFLVLLVIYLLSYHDKVPWFEKIVWSVLPRLSNQPALSEVLIIALCPVAFVLAGTMTAPKYRYIVGILLILAAQSLCAVLVVVPAAKSASFAQHSYDGYVRAYLMATVGCLIMARLSRSPKYARPRVILLVVALYALVATMLL